MSETKQEIVYDAYETDAIAGGNLRLSGWPCFSVTRRLVVKADERRRWNRENNSAFQMATFRIHAINGATAGRVADECKWRLEDEIGVHARSAA